MHRYDTGVVIRVGSRASGFSADAAGGAPSGGVPGLGGGVPPASAGASGVASSRSSDGATCHVRKAFMAYARYAWQWHAHGDGGVHGGVHEVYMRVCAWGCTGARSSSRRVCSECEMEERRRLLIAQRLSHSPPRAASAYEGYTL